MEFVSPCYIRVFKVRVLSDVPITGSVRGGRATKRCGYPAWWSSSRCARTNDSGPFHESSSSPVLHRLPPSPTRASFLSASSATPTAPRFRHSTKLVRRITPRCAGDTLAWNTFSHARYTNGARPHTGGWSQNLHLFYDSRSRVGDLELLDASIRDPGPSEVQQLQVLQLLQLLQASIREIGPGEVKRR